MGGILWRKCRWGRKVSLPVHGRIPTAFPSRERGNFGIRDQNQEGGTGWIVSIERN
uniref:Uncharacterized protein n=1 Tax=Rhizophora mucronata TaxID=61149 RepID=A0A2P2J536_RHIMU